MRNLMLMLVMITLFSAKALPQKTSPNMHQDTFPAYDQLTISVYLNAHTEFELDVLITESQDIFANIEDLFRNVGIPCSRPKVSETLVGFLKSERDAFIIDLAQKNINVNQKIFSLNVGLIEDSGFIYIESSLISQAFGITLSYNQRSLSANLSSDFELPLIRQLRLEKMRKNISGLREQKITADTIVDRDYHFFKFGVFDWGITSFQTMNRVSNTHINLGAGAELLYGQTNVALTLNTEKVFDNRQLLYNWKWVDNNKTMIRQAQLGTLLTESISFLNSPVIGASVSNVPTRLRKADGYFTIQERTEPNWTVELYLNNILVDYTTADASGLFVFKVPVIYGYTVANLRFYSPLGEERSEERIINIPFTFLPAKTFEYNLLGGVMQSDPEAQFAQANFNYGVNYFFTLGGGMEYLSNVQGNSSIPYGKVAVQPLSKLIINLNYAHNVRLQTLLNYNFAKNAFLELDYSRYKKGQMVTRFNALEERKVRIFLPFKVNKVNLFTKLNFNQLVYQNFKYNQMEMAVSAFYRQLSVNSTVLLNWVNEKPAFSTNNLSLSWRPMTGFIFRPNIEYNIVKKQVSRIRLELEKRMSNTNFLISYQRDMIYHSDNLSFSFKYFLPFARTGIAIMGNKNNIIYSENAQGSFAFGGGNDYVEVSDNSALSRGGIIFYPFLDLNLNGKKDSGEKMVLLSNVNVKGGQAFISEVDSIVRISNLNAFVDYYIEFSENDLANIAWRMKHKSYQVMVDPNQFKKIEIPIYPAGEINGTVYLVSGNIKSGLSRMTVEIYNQNGDKVASVLSEYDGYFSYLGLLPGEYTVRMDAKQLEKLNYEATPALYQATIKVLENGDILSGLDFSLEGK